MVANDARFAGSRWDALRLGIRLSEQSLTMSFFMALFYGLWCVIGVVLVFIYLPMALTGKGALFEQWLKTLGTFGFYLPLGLLFVAAWVVRLFSRFLWCAIPDPLYATVLAAISFAGRLAMIFGGIVVARSRVPFREALLLAPVVVAAGVGWIGLLAEWAFARTVAGLGINFAKPSSPAVQSPPDNDDVEEDEDEDDSEPGKNESEKPVLKRDIGKWFEERYPRMSAYFRFFIAPIAMIALISLSHDGDLSKIPRAMLTMAVVGPLILQVLWTPDQEVRLISEAAASHSEPAASH